MMGTSIVPPRGAETASAPMQSGRMKSATFRAAVFACLAISMSACAGKKVNPGPLPGQQPIVQQTAPVAPAVRSPSAVTPRVPAPGTQPFVIPAAPESAAPQIAIPQAAIPETIVPQTIQPQITGPLTPPSQGGAFGTPQIAKRFTFASIPGWAEGDHAPVLLSLRDACDKLGDGALDASVGGIVFNGEPVFGRGTDWRPICADAKRADTRRATAFFEQWFEPVSINGAGEAGASLYTAYFEPELRGSRVRGGPYQYPIYAKPSDLRSDVPYFERAAIQRGALAGRGLELFWIDDPVEAFFLEIQGSGRVRLPDGEVARVGFAGKNGHAYKAIGRTLVEWNELTLEQVSAQSIKDWIRANPQRRDALLASNKSYVFFIERPELAADPSLGPIGTFGTPLPAMRSIAIDRRSYPLGIPFWIDFESPVGPMQRLVIALDTGGAIKGSRRADFFFGSGDGPGQAAGATRAMGRLIALAPTSALRRVFRAGS
jgi:membrane-bound lytic murein transglycosylase A